MLRWRKPERPLGKGSCGKASSSRWWGACCNGRRAKGSGSPSIPRRVETAGVAPSVAPEGGATGIFQCPHCSRPQDPPNPPGPEAPGGAQARQPPCSPTSPTAGYERPASMSPARLMKAPSCRGAPVPRLNTVPDFARWHSTQRERARLLSHRHGRRPGGAGSHGGDSVLNPQLHVDARFDAGEPVEHRVPAGELLHAVPEAVDPLLLPCPAHGDATGAVAGKAAVQLGAPVVGLGGVGGKVRRTGCAEGPITLDFDVDTDGDNGESGRKPNGSFAVGPTSTSPTRLSGRPPRFMGRERPGWKSASTTGPVRGTAGWDRSAGVVGRVFRVYKGPLGSSEEVGGSLPVRPSPASRGPACRSRVSATEGHPPTKRLCTGGSWTWGPQTAQSPLEDT